MRYKSKSIIFAARQSEANFVKIGHPPKVHTLEIKMTAIPRRGREQSLTLYNPLDQIPKLPDGIRPIPYDDIQIYDENDFNSTRLEETRDAAKNWKLNDLLNRIHATEKSLQSTNEVQKAELISLLMEVQRELLILAASSRTI